MAGLAFLLAGGPELAQAQSFVTVCTHEDLVAAIEEARGSDGLVIIDCDGNILITNTIHLTIASNTNSIITDSIIIDASNSSVTLTGSTGTNDANAVRFFTVDSGISLTLIHLNLANGRSTNGGAIFVNPNAFLNVSECVFSNNVALGSDGVSAVALSTNSAGRMGRDGRNGTPGRSAFGGAVYNLGTAEFDQCVFLTNTVAGGHGGDGGDGGSGTLLAGNGGSGGRGGVGLGGAIFNHGLLNVTNCTFNQNIAVGGFGGVGGEAGTGSIPGEGGRGAGGGAGAGAAVFNQRDSSNNIVSSTFALNGTASGDSASAANGERLGARGPNGPDTSGGALANYGAALLHNCTFFGNVAFAGNAGDGGDGNVQGGRGGNGGSAWGGNVFNGGKRATLEAIHCTFSDGGATGGTNGLGGAGGFLGRDGNRGMSRGGNIANSNGVFLLYNSVIAYPEPGVNGFGKFHKDSNFNLSSDRSIKFNRRLDNLTNIDPRLEILAKNGGLVETMELLPESPAIDAGGEDFALETDARGEPRPFGDAVDMGAYEADADEVLGPPRITVQPTNASFFSGEDATLGVVAAGSAPLRYQWHLNGVAPVANATNSALTVPNVQAGNAGSYHVTISNSLGSATSSSATLGVSDSAPVITLPPSDVEVDPGGDATFTVGAIGSKPFGYQWYFLALDSSFNIVSTTSLTNATASLSLLNVRGTNEGIYRVVVTNSFGSDSSENYGGGATLNVRGVFNPFVP